MLELGQINSRILLDKIEGRSAEPFLPAVTSWSRTRQAVLGRYECRSAGRSFRYFTFNFR